VTLKRHVRFLPAATGNSRTSARGAVSLSHKQIIGTRQLEVPWANSALPEWLAAGGVVSYRGESRAEFDPASGVPDVPGQPVTLAHTFDRAAGTAVIGQQASQIATAPGLPASESTVDRVYGSAQFDGIWVPPEVFSQLRPQQLLDQDQITGQTVTFGGIQGQTAVIVISGPGDQLEQFYDVASGILTFSRYQRQIPGTGVNITELTLVGQA